MLGPDSLHPAVLGGLGVLYSPPSPSDALGPFPSPSLASSAAEIGSKFPPKSPNVSRSASASANSAFWKSPKSKELTTSSSDSEDPEPKLNGSPKSDPLAVRVALDASEKGPNPS